MEDRANKSVCALRGIFERCAGVADSKEHIIPNAIGGVLKNSDCICVNCNNESGRIWDAALTKQFNILCIFFGVRRERGKVQSEVIKNNGGEELVISPEGTVQPRCPVFNEQDLGAGKVSINVQSNNREQARRIVKGIAKKKGYKYSDADIEYAEALLSGDLDFSMNFDLAGDEVGRSLVKMLYLFSVSNGIHENNLNNAWHYLSVNPSPQCFFPYYQHDPVLARPIGVPIHVLFVVGDSKQKILYGYIEILGLFKYLVLLSDNYEGEYVFFKHVLDPTKGVELSIAVELNFTKEELFFYLKPSKETYDRSNAWIAENMPLYMDGWERKGHEHRYGILIKNFISECGLEKLNEFPGWLEQQA